MNHDFPLSSPAFGPGVPIPNRHAAEGENLSPPLEWSGLPRGTKELALIVEDSDAIGGPRAHWVLYNIPASAEGLPEGVQGPERVDDPPGATNGVNEWDEFGYRGPGPVEGEEGAHYYQFTLFALDAPLRLVPGLSRRSLQKAMVGHVLGRGELLGTFMMPPSVENQTERPD